MKQTAVQWLQETLSLTFEQQMQFEGLFQQAIQMEKEQMRSASCPYIGGWEEGEFEYWYNEKFKK